MNRITSGVIHSIHYLPIDIMNIEIITTGFNVSIHGFSDTAENKDYVGKAFQLMDKMWQIVKSKGIKNKGKNIWVYEPGEKVFAGVELDGTVAKDTGMEQKNIHLAKYGHYKHIGPYQLIKQSGQRMTDELKQRGFEIISPCIEIYGHWTNDESKLETELLMALK